MQIYSGAHLIVYLCFAFIIGACIGSFLNVCILRIPRKISLSLPGSHCYSCGSDLGLGENIPIIGYFILKGKCKHCGSTFSFQYAWVEVITALFSVMFFICSLTPRSTFDPLAFALKLTFFSVLLVASLIDLKWEIIPDKITIPLALFFISAHYLLPSSFPYINHIQINNWAQPNVIIALLFLYVLYFFFSHVEQERKKINILNLVLLIALIAFFIYLNFSEEPTSEKLIAIKYSIIGAICTGGLLYFIALPFKLFLKKNIIGEGDIKLLFVVGAFIGGMNSFNVLKIWLYLAAAFASILIYLQVSKKPIQKIEKIVGGVFLVMMLTGIILISYLQIFVFNYTIFIIGLSVFFSAVIGYYFLAKKWIDLKIVSKGFPMAPFISIAALAYFFYIVDVPAKLKLLSQIF